ncbi:DUF4402 domain-containing protein [Sphingopyxis indica]|nr:DUF4402 domain-containing protein [Sphingopyxis indica]
MRPILALGLLLAAPSGAGAQCLLCAKDDSSAFDSGRAAGRDTPLHVEIETQLDFSRVAVGAMGGEVALDPATGARRLSGQIVDLGGYAVSGVVSVRGAPGAELRVILPPTVDLESGSGGRARVTGLVTDLAGVPRLGPDGRLRFRFGGRLQLDARDDGDYRGRIPVTVEYQ